MKYCKNYCEEEGISTSELNEAQRTLYYIAENMKMGESISEEGYRHFQMAIKALEQEPKTGHWITEVKSDLRGDMWPTNPKCSICGKEPYYSNTIYNYKFCPYCGAKMIEPKESEVEE